MIKKIISSILIIFLLLITDLSIVFADQECGYVFDCAGNIVGEGECQDFLHTNRVIFTDIGRDECGVCYGNNDTCLGCDENIDISATQLKLDGATGNLKNLVKTVGRKLKRIDSGARTRRLVINKTAEAEALYVSSWTLAWSVPSVQLQCSNTSLCVSVSNADVIEDAIEYADNLRSLVKKLVRRLRKLKGNSTAGRKYIKQATALYDSVVESTKVIPETSSSCN